MKKPIIFFLTLVFVFTLTGCKKSTGSQDNGTNSGSMANDPVNGNDMQKTEPGSATVDIARCRIVDGAETGSLVLAGDDVYTLSVGDIPVYLDGELADASVLEDGMMAEIAFDGSIMETYPAQFSDVTAIYVYSRGTEQNPMGTYYDLCGLYLKVLSDLWDTDAGLNGGAEYVSVDLTDAPVELTEGEKAAIAWIFANEHSATPLTLSYDELLEGEYLTPIEDVPNSYLWENGLLFSITASEWAEGEAYSLPVVKFNAEKWRTPLGAYYFSDCKAVWAEDGSWGDYSVGAELIS